LISWFVNGYNSLMFKKDGNTYSKAKNQYLSFKSIHTGIVCGVY